jgi:hypothetical protein
MNNIIRNTGYETDFIHIIEITLNIVGLDFITLEKKPTLKMKISCPRHATQSLPKLKLAAVYYRIFRLYENINTSHYQNNIFLK